MTNSTLRTLLFAGLILVSAVTAAADITQRPAVQEFIATMAQQHRFTASDLTALFRRIELKPDIVAAMNRPAEAKPWHQYRPIFVTQKRAREGAEFMQRNRETLARAETTYGVPPQIIAAIIGVESRYGQHHGKHRVLDALATLAFDFPRRAQYFRTELTQFLLLAREEGVDPASVMGSYAGAMGMPQFMPSSYRLYAVDFDGDGKRDLWNNTVDTIGSVAHYFQIHGWIKDQPVTVRAQVVGNDYKELLTAGMKPKQTLDELKQRGINVSGALPADLKATLIALESRQATEHWVGLQNFYVITRYNHSRMYAMAVYQLSEAFANPSALN